MNQQLESSRRSVQPWGRRLILILLSGAVLVQSWWLLSWVGKGVFDVWRAAGQHGLWRSANFARGQRFANYVAFLHETVPPDALVVLPPKGSSPWDSSIGPFMQFFLAPREVVNCTEDYVECVESFSRSGAYTLAVDPQGYPGKHASANPDRFQLMDGEIGVYLPEKEFLEGGAALLPFGAANEILISTLWPGLWLMALSLAGAMILWRLAPQLRFAAKLALGGALGFGWLSLSLYLLQLIGLPMNPATVAASSLAWFLLAGLAFYAGKMRFSAMRAEISIDVWELGFVSLALFAAIVSVGKGYHTSDAIVLWGAKGYGVWAQGLREGASNWGTLAVRYPLHMPIVIAAFRTLFGESLPASKLFFSLCYAGLLLVSYAAIKRKLPGNLAGLFVLVLGTTPLIFRHATIGYANLPFAFHYLSAVVLAWFGFSRGSRATQFLSGLFFVLTAWTRPEGLIISWVTVAVIALLMGQKLKAKQDLLSFFAPIVTFTALWIPTSRAVYFRDVREADLARQAVIQIASGDFHLGEAGFILEFFLRQFFNVEIWGVLGFGILLLALFGLLRLTRKSVFSSLELTSGILYTGLLFAIYYLTAFDSGHDIGWWVGSGLSRLSMPGMTLLWIGLARYLAPALSEKADE